MQPGYATAVPSFRSRLFPGTATVLPPSSVASGREVSPSFFYERAYFMVANLNCPFSPRFQSTSCEHLPLALFPLPFLSLMSSKAGFFSCIHEANADLTGTASDQFTCGDLFLLYAFSPFFSLQPTGQRPPLPPRELVGFFLKGKVIYP